MSNKKLDQIMYTETENIPSQDCSIHLHPLLAILSLSCSKLFRKQSGQSFNICRLDSILCGFSLPLRVLPAKLGIGTVVPNDFIKFIGEGCVDNMSVLTNMGF
jgi:hypothetical protein